MGDGPENESREAYEAKVSALGRAYADALLSADEVAAEIAIREAMDAGLDTAQIDDEIIAPALWHVGDLWERGEISVADEHLATEISIRVLALQREAQRVAQHPRRLTGSCWPLPPASFTSSRCAWSTTSCATPATTWRCSAPTCPPRRWPPRNRRPPHVVCLTSTMPDAAGEVLAAIDAVQRRWPDVGFVVGGSGLTARVHPRPGIDVCRRVSDAVEAVDAMVRGGGRN